MNAIATTAERQPRSVLVDMSARFGMEPAAFEATVRATCMKPDKNGKVPSREEFAAFLLVAKEYKLNPLTKEIYAYPAKGGGIVPIVSIDGWANLINSHPSMDGVTFAMDHDEAGALVSCTCRIYRKDRSHPIEITEYLAECIRSTEPWQMKHRMLRHKSLIQCARYAFGFSGIYDEDEGAKIAEMRDVTPMSRPQPPKPPAPPSQQISGPAETIDNETGEITVDATAQGIDADQAETVDDSMTGDGETLGDYFTKFDEAMALATDAAGVAEVWNDFDPLSKFEGDEDSQALAQSIKRKHVQRVGQK